MLKPLLQQIFHATMYFLVIEAEPAIHRLVCGKGLNVSVLLPRVSIFTLLTQKKEDLILYLSPKEEKQENIFLPAYL